METAPLKSFAAWARTALIREVTARISVVLGSQELRQEQPNAVAALEKAVNANGGSDKGRDTVADKVAYSWFNRIIALRFMDANGYTGIGVVSPEPGREGGQPEVLSEAKRGNIDSAVVTNKRTVERVTSLLNGTRRSDDPQGEAYALLLAEYCRHWNRSMPFMFEREGDYTELLIPANLLAADSVLGRAANVLAEEVCQDVEVIGWLYQFYISARKDEVFAGFKKNRKATTSDIPAATQLFTPHWIVKYLVENSLGRLWLLNNPHSSLADQMEYYIAPEGTETDFLRISGPEELRVLDPACGSGHMLTYAFDLLYMMYEESGYPPSDIPGLILRHNLFGAEIDHRAGALAAFALVMKARGVQRSFLNKGKGTEPNVCVLEPVRFTTEELATLVARGGNKRTEIAFWQAFEDADMFGSLIRPNQALIQHLKEHLESLEDVQTLFDGSLVDRARTVIRQSEYLSTRYHVVVANPPYMGAKNMDPKLSQWLTKNDPVVKADLFAAFILRNTDLALDGGHLGFMTPYVWMFISSYEKLRAQLIDQKTITSLVQLEYSGFDGATVPICTFTLKNSAEVHLSGTYIRLTDFRGAENQGPRALEAIGDPMCEWRFTAATRDFRNLPGVPIAYWIADEIAPAFAGGTSLATVAYTRIGLITGDNNRYLREWFEVSSAGIATGMTRIEAAESGRRWFPISKGGEYRKWYGNATAVVDWQHDGRQLQTRLDPTGSRVLAHNFNLDDIFREGVTWSKISSGRFSGRYHPAGYIFNDPSANIFPSTSSVSVLVLLAYLSSNVADFLLRALNPTLNFQPGNVASLPWPATLSVAKIEDVAREALSIARADWDEAEVSREFSENPLVAAGASGLALRETLAQVMRALEARSARLAELEQQNNLLFADSLGLATVVDPAVALKDVTLSTNADWAFGHVEDADARRRMLAARRVEDLVSYAVGCMFGRYSLDASGLILANQGDTLQDYLETVPNPSFMPDKDNVLPILSDGWFLDDIVERFRDFLKVSFGEDHFQENLRFVEDALGKDMRKYFVQDFYKDHVQRYKKRPIYWLFSSPKGSFNALIYMHRYTRSTVSTVLNEYLREFKAKLAASREHHERLAAGTGAPRQQAAAQKEVDRLRKVLLELDEYEHDVLYPLATQQVQIDLDDGVKANYPKLGAALKKIPGLEASDE